ncbi:MAG: hypothetical protein JWN60_2088 [Acidobacteria bacterium]|nr:hypothetical protein [Acidobacteriota bacterium]
MNINDTETAPESSKSERNTKEVILEDFVLNPLSSADLVKKTVSPESDIVSNVVAAVPANIAGADTPELENVKEKDPVFAELAEPKLPELERENRARLQMQSPNRLFFYWSLKNNPYQILRKTFGGRTGNYQMVVKLINHSQNREDLYPVEAEGNWWFNVEAASSYQAEIGFYAPNRPFIRVIYSNAVETPRKTPSPRHATDADWAVTATDFAEVLDFSGFSRDAFEVALAGDDEQAALNATGSALSQLIGKQITDSGNINAEEIRFALLALASGVSLSELRGYISEALYVVLRENAAALSAEKSLAALQQHFEVFAEEITEAEEIGSAVFGASLIHFPKTIKKRVVPKNISPKLAPKLLSKLSPKSSL